MVKNLLIIIILISSLSMCFAQAKKPVHYYDPDGREISEKEYIIKKRYHKESISYLSLTFENDSLYAVLLVKRKNYGILSKQKFDSLYNNISVTKNTPSKEFTIIQYHPGKDRCNGGNVGSLGNRYERRYLSKLKKKFDFINYWIYKEDSELNFKKSRIDWQSDKNQIVEKLFFKHHYPCSSFVIINNKNRRYISIFGEYGKQNILEIAEEISSYD